MSLPPAGEIVLEARSVEHRFAPSRGLKPATFSHRGPGCVVVLGPNGSGKSTLLRIVAGLLRPSGGSVELRLDGWAVPPQERRRVVGFVSEGLSFYEELTVGENLAFVAEARGMKNNGSTLVRDALTQVGLLDRIDDRVASLSSGMKQRLRLAFALLHRPPLLLLDEPGSHLDVAGRAVTEAIVAGHRARGLVLLATNDERETALADSRVELHGGLGHPA